LSEAIGQTLPFAVGIALSPVPIIGVVLMLATPRARQNGLAFLLGWIVGLAVAGTVVLLISGGADAGEGGDPSDWVNVVKLVLGVVLLWLGLKQWRSRPRAGEQATLPAWMERVDRFNAPRAMGLAVLLSAVNPKNLVLIVGAAAAIAQTAISGGDQAIALAIFVVLATLGPAIPVVIYIVMGERSRPLLDDLKGWMSRNSNAIMTVICLLLAAKLIGDGISGF